MTEHDFDALLKSYGMTPRMQRDVKAEYTAMYSEWYRAASNFEGDYSMACPARRFARAVSAAGLQVMTYKFSKQPSFPVGLMYGNSASKVPQVQWGAYHG